MAAMDYGYDFGSGMPLPPSHHYADDHETNQYTSFLGCCRTPFRSFSRSADAELIDYLRSRHVSPSFLTEVDRFLYAHPEIAKYKPEWTEEINHSRPLDAYLWFVKGWTRPARYIEGFLPDHDDIPLIFEHEPLVQKYDAELVEFFYGYDYRYDILEHIDREVRELVMALYRGHQVGYAQRRLVVLTLYGNLVDVFKFYEYNYQTDWLQHRYLAEHVILTELPKPADYTQPIARQLAQPDETRREGDRSHLGTRLRMARACDAGVDVLEVLLDDFTAALCRRGLRRGAIHQLRVEAQRNIDHQRSIGGGRDLVDLVMNKAYAMQGPDFAAMGRSKAAKKDRAQQERAARVDLQKRNLQRLYAQEAAAQEFPLVRDAIKVTRKRVETALVTDFTELAVQGGLMGNREMQQWRALFSKKSVRQRELRGETLNFFKELAGYP